MALTIEDVEKVARLARLHLTDEEVVRFQEQLSAVLEHVEMLSELDLTGVAPTAHAVAQENVFREDLARPSLPVEEVLYNAPRHTQQQFLIQTVLDEEE